MVMVINLKVLTRVWGFAIFIVLLLISQIQTFSQQKGAIVGIVLDYQTGEVVVGANVLIEGTNIGAATDLEGNFRIENVQPGKYNLIISHIAYARTVVKDVVVSEGKIARIKVTLKPEAVQMGEIVVTQEFNGSYENALLNRRKKASTINDGISSELIRRSNDVTSSDALRRIPGVTLLDNKFIFVRGTSERYSNAQLNNASLSSTEPEKKSFAFDLIPTSLVGDITIVKSFSPDIPGDFAGGTVQINTIDFPDRLTINLSYSSSVTSNTTFKDFNTYQGGGDFWGFGRNGRKLPADFPDNLANGNYSREEINSLARLLPNVWAPTTKKAPISHNFALSIGDMLFNHRVGFVTAFSFRNSYKNLNIERNEYEALGEQRYSFSGVQSIYSTMMGGLLNLTFKASEKNKISLRNTYIHSSDDEVSILNGVNYSDAGKEQIQTAIRFVEREVFSSQLAGEHLIPSFNLKVDWKVFYSNSLRDEPDYRRVIYGRDIGTNDPFYAILGSQANLKNGGRFFSHLFDRTRGASIDLNIFSRYGRYKFGAYVEGKNRNFTSRLISVIVNAPGNGFTDFNLLYLPLDQIFNPESFRRNGFSLDEYQNGTNNYSAKHEIISIYGMVEIPTKIFGEDITFISGVRLENSLQQINSFDISGRIPLSYQLKKIDLLPSLNVIHKISETTNLRLSYSQTINRPELRELAPFSYFDFTTQTTLTGNPNLRRALVRNYDIRLEIFPSVRELISVSVFYKGITDAIEKVVVKGVSLGAERTFMNSDFAKIYGFELEARVTLGFLGEYFRNVLIKTNYSWIKSIVDVKATEATVARGKRPLQGQSPYVINFGIFFTEPKLGTSLSFVYNRIGRRIVEVANTYEEDVIEQPRDMVDIVISQPIFTSFEIRLGIKDLLAKERIFTQGDKRARIDSQNRSISLGISFKLKN